MMRRATWMVLATAALWLVGCATAPLGPSAITDIEGVVAGYQGVADVAYEGRITPMSSVVATGVLSAASATFDTVPLDELQTIDAFFAPLLGKGGTCDLNVPPDDLEIGFLTTFRAGDGSLLGLALHDPWAAGPPVAGDTVYLFVFATRVGRVDGACTDMHGGVTTFEMPLAHGWNTVAVRVLTVDEGIATEHRWRTEVPDTDAAWWYRAPVKKIF